MAKMNNWRAAKKRNLTMLNNSFNYRYKKRERTQNWSTTDKALLFELVKDYKDVVDSKTTTANQKFEAWEVVHKKFAKKCEAERSITRIKEQWGRMKAVAKLEMSNYNSKIEQFGLKEAEKHKPSELSINIWNHCSETKPATDTESSEETEKATEVPESSENNVPEIQEKSTVEKVSEERLSSPTKEIEISEPVIKVEREEEIPSFSRSAAQESIIDKNSLLSIKQLENEPKRRKLTIAQKVNQPPVITVTATSETSSSTTPIPIAPHPGPQRIYVRGNLLKQTISPLRIKPAQNRLVRIIPPPVESKKPPTPPVNPVISSTVSPAAQVPLRLLLSKNVHQKVVQQQQQQQQQASRAATLPHMDSAQIEQKKKLELLDLQLEIARVQKETALNELRISAMRRQMTREEIDAKYDGQVKMTGERGSGVGKGGGGGGAVREAGGSFGKMEAAHEDQYFYNLQKEQITKLREGLHDEISFHEEQIKRHQEAISRHKKRITDMENK